MENVRRHAAYHQAWFRACFKMIRGKLINSNPGKFQFMILGTKSDIKVKPFLDGNKIEKSQEFVLLGITIEYKLSFATHIENIKRYNMQESI